MTRRTLVFIDEYGKFYITPEFNGDKTEFEKFGSQDSCEKDWEEIETLFQYAKTLDQFKEANEKAQGFYHSSLPEKEILPIVPIEYTPVIEGIREISNCIFVKE